MVRRVSAAIGLCMVAAACGTSAPSTDGALPKVSVTHLTVVEPPATTAAPAGAAVTTPSTPTSATGGAPVRVMPLGDSLTQGTGKTAADSAQSYRGPLQAILGQHGYVVDLVGSDDTPSAGGDDADNEGHGGFTIGPDESELCNGCPAANLDAHVADWIDQAQPDVIVLLIGVNDLFPLPERTNGVLRPVDPDEAPAKLTALVERILAEAPRTDVLVASYPPLALFQTPGSTGKARLDALNAAARSLDGAEGRVRYVPLAEQLALRWTAEDNVADGVHPSASGAAKMAEVLAASLMPVLDQRA